MKCVTNMLILITGVPGCGKTTIATEIARKSNLNFKVLNDKTYSASNHLGTYEEIDNSKEYVVSIRKLNISISNYLKKNKTKNIILEGHLWSELMKVILKKMNFVLVLSVSKRTLRKRLYERNYNVLKVEENVVCQDSNYFENLLKKSKIDYKVIKLDSNLRLNYNKVNKFLKL